MSMPSFHSSFSSEDDGYGSCDNAGGSLRRDYPKRRRPMATDVFANDALTSFRVSRRSSKTSEDDDRLVASSKDKTNIGGNKSSKEIYNLKIRKSKDTTKTTTLGPQSTSQASSRRYTSERLEGSANTLIIEEPLPEVPDGTREMPRNERNLSLRSLLSSTSSRRSVNREFAVLVEEGGDDNPESTNQQQEQEKLKWVSSFRTACGNFVNSMSIQIFMSLMLVANAIVLGLLTVESLPTTTIRALEITDEVMLCAFTLEILLHGIYLGPRRLLQDSWLTFDFLVILFSWCFLESNLNVMRSFRIFRIFSLVSRWESLRSLFEAIGSTIPRMSSIWLSLLLFFYVFCVLFTSMWSGLFEDGYLEMDYFGDLGLTFVTLFQIMTLDNWINIAREVMKSSPWGFLGFFFFINVSSFFIVNLVAAVLCESLIQISRGSKEEKTESNAEQLPKSESNKERCNDTTENSNNALEVMMQQILRNDAHMRASILELQEELRALRQTM